MKSVWFYAFPICNIGIAEWDGAIAGLFFSDKKEMDGHAAVETPLIAETAKQLVEYFDGKRISFDLPLVFHGTVFQNAVWSALQTIPYGETRSYKDIAALTGNAKASRAVGMANNRNPIAIIVPCHRVIGQNGALTGYAGGLSIKQRLLELEKRYA